MVISLSESKDDAMGIAVRKGCLLGNLSVRWAYIDPCTFHHYSLVPLMTKLFAHDAWRTIWCCMGYSPEVHSERIYPNSHLVWCVVPQFRYVPLHYEEFPRYGIDNPIPCLWERSKDLPRLPRGRFGLETYDNRMQTGL